MFILWPLPASSQPKDEHRRTLSTSLNCLCYNGVRHQEPCSERREGKETRRHHMASDPQEPKTDTNGQKPCRWSAWRPLTKTLPWKSLGQPGTSSKKSKPRWWCSVLRPLARTFRPCRVCKLSRRT